MGAQARDSATRGSAMGVRARLALGMAVFGSATPVSKIVTGAMPVFVGSLFRVGLGALVLAPAAFSHRDQVRRLDRAGWVLLGLIAVFGMFGFSALMLYGMSMVSGVVGAVVMATTPAVTAGASMLFLHDSPTWRKLAAIAAAVVGVGLLQLGQGGEGSSSGNVLVGSALVFGAVCCEASYTLLGKKATEKADPILVAFLGAALSVPLFVPFAIWQLQDFDVSSVTWGAWSAAIWYGAGTLALGSWLWYSGVARAEGVVAAGFMGVMPASALVLSYVLLGEAFRWVHVVGFGVVFVGVLLISWEHAQMERRERG